MGMGVFVNLNVDLDELLDGITESMELESEEMLIFFSELCDYINSSGPIKNELMDANSSGWHLCLAFQNIHEVKAFAIAHLGLIEDAL